jgi:hypothetical protein
MIEVSINGTKLFRWFGGTPAAAFQIEQDVVEAAYADDTTPEALAHALISHLMQSVDLPSDERQGAMKTILWLLLSVSWPTPERLERIRDYVEGYDFYCNITNPPTNPPREFDLHIRAEEQPQRTTFN